MFAYCGNNPVNCKDSSGCKPGDLFDTMDEAAIDAARYINEESIKNNREYSTAIYIVETVHTETINKTYTFLWWTISVSYDREVHTIQYTYDEPIPGDDDGAKIPSAPESMELAAFFHTHAAYDPAYNNDNFSWGDFEIANGYQVPIYVATPFGHLRRYDPSDGTNVRIDCVIPADPNRPTGGGGGR